MIARIASLAFGIVAPLALVGRALMMHSDRLAVGAIDEEGTWTATKTSAPSQRRLLPCWC